MAASSVRVVRVKRDMETESVVGNEETQKVTSSKFVLRRSARLKKREAVGTSQIEPSVTKTKAYVTKKSTRKLRERSGEVKVKYEGVKRIPAGVSTKMSPPLDAEKFGLIQEELRGNAFHLLVGTTFLNKTRGSVAVPLLRQFLADYPTPLALSRGNLQKITNFLQPLGLQNIRADRLIRMATVWVADPPTLGKVVKKSNYPPRGTKPFSFPRSSKSAAQMPELGVDKDYLWEIAHLPGVGAYALDSWRIFCRDEFRRTGGEFIEEEEWKSVVPMDKELRAYIKWKWAKEDIKMEGP